VIVANDLFCIFRFVRPTPYCGRPFVDVKATNPFCVICVSLIMFVFLAAVDNCDKVNQNHKSPFLSYLTRSILPSEFPNSVRYTVQIRFNARVRGATKAESCDGVAFDCPDDEQYAVGTLCRVGMAGWLIERHRLSC
jgi:hypothetical protein